MSRARFVLLGLVASCGSGGGGNGGDGGPHDARVIDAPKVIDSMPGPDATQSSVCAPKHGTTLKLVPVADNLEQPVAITAPPGDSSRLFIVQQTGAIRVVDNGQLQATPFLTINLNQNNLGLENGLLGLAFHPQYASNGRFFVLYSLADGTGNLRLAEYHANPTSDVADSTPEKVILDLTHEYGNDNAGTIVFGPEGDLYLSVGDGGGASDFLGHAEDQASLLAKVLRLDVDNGTPYAIPSDNPWANSTTQAKEAFVWGLRNPWKIAIDSSNGDLWIGDVNQTNDDEIDVVRHGTSGQDFGWSSFQGTTCYASGYTAGADCATRGATQTAPVMVRDTTANGGAIVLAGVYRGTCMPDLVGQVFFGDYRAGDVHSIPASSTSIAFTSATDYTAALDPTGLLFGDISSFGFDGTGELYVAAITRGAVYRIEVQ